MAFLHNLFSLRLRLGRLANRKQIVEANVGTREKGARGYDPAAQEAWRKELNIPVRFPRDDFEDVKQMLIDLPLPKVLIRENAKTTDVVIRLGCSSRQLSRVHKRIYFGNGITFPMVFDQVLAKTTNKGRSRLGSELSRLGYDAYRQAWIQLFEILYLNQFHPSANPDSWLEKFKSALKRNPGRHKQEGEESFKKRFAFFLKHCEKLRCSIEPILRRSGTDQTATATTTPTPPPNAIEKQIKQSLWKEITKIPRGVSILGGEAFEEIPYSTENKHPKIENLKSWTSRQLAIALLAIESGLNYQTVGKKVAARRRPRSNRTQ
jgi:hypothetical protein